MIKRFIAWLFTTECKHFWRPAICEVSVQDGYRVEHLARACKDCGKTEVLTPERFYAEFGIIPPLRFRTR